MKYRGRAHELEVQSGYRCAWANCKCGWGGAQRETIDEIFTDYRQHVKRIDEIFRRA